MPTGKLKASSSQNSMICNPSVFIEKLSIERLFPLIVGFGIGTNKQIHIQCETYIRTYIHVLLFMGRSKETTGPLFRDTTEMFPQKRDEIIMH